MNVKRKRFMNYITFDIETYIPEGVQDKSSGGRLDTKSMRVSVTGAYISWLDKYLVFWEEQTEEFLEYLKMADYTVGFNHISFDLAVLQKYSPNFDLMSLNNYDLMMEFAKKAGHRIKLDNLAKSNLDHKKTDSFQNFRDYHLTGKWFELADYCMHDVLITEELHQMALKSRELVYFDFLDKKSVMLDKPMKKDIHAKSINNNQESNEHELF
jgi:hypothetical protein